MEYYLELQTSIQWKNEWFHCLRNELKSLPVRWQDSRIASYHLTAAFMDDMRDIDAACNMIDSFNMPGSAAIDKIEVFTAFNGNEHIICLSACQPFDQLVSSIHSIRDKLACSGASIFSPFRFHITIGKINASAVTLDELKKCVDKVHIPPFEVQFVKMRLVRRKGHVALLQKELEQENIFSYESVRMRCEMFHDSILRHEPLAYVLKNRKVRFINPLGRFDYATFGNFYFNSQGVMMLITKHRDYTLYHRRDELGDCLWSTVPVIYAGIETGFRDDTGREIYTCDIVSDNEYFASMVRYLPWEKEPSLQGDNCDMMLSECHRLHVEGTLFSYMKEDMFDSFDVRDVCWSYSQFCQGGMSREEVFQRARMAFDKPHFIEPIAIRRRSPNMYLDIRDEMTGNYKLAALTGIEEYDGGIDIGATIFANNIPEDYDEPIDSIEIDTEGSLLDNLKEALSCFFVRAHEHPDTKYILCDFANGPFINVEIYKKKDIARHFLPLHEYEIGNVVVPAWIWLDVMQMY